mgnify:CR=1 FL=1
MINNFKSCWEDIINEETLPRYINNIQEYTYDNFKEIVLNNDQEQVEQIVKSLYSGDVFILRGAYTSEFVESLKEKLFNWGQTTESEFYKTYEGVPNFHRVIDEEISGKYAIKQLWHIFYLFPWNKDHLDVYEEINKRWKIMKMISGYNSDEFSKNTPKDGIIDRIHLYQYPKGGGYIETHSDPYKINKTIMTTKLSTRGEEYNNGGLYFFRDDKTKIDIEDGINKGDIYFCFPTLIHGVDPVDPDEDIDWNSKKGRWLLGPWSIDSDEVKDRDTCFGVDETKLNYEFNQLNKRN